MKKMIKRGLSVALASTMMVGLLSGCGSSSSTTASSSKKETADTTASSNESTGAVDTTGCSDSLTVYTAFPEAEVITYINAFEEETGIKVDYIRLSAGEMLTRVAAEKDNPQAALLLGGSTDNYIAAAEQDLLEPYQAADLSDIPEEYIDPDGVWDPIYVGAICFACNKEWFEDKGYDYPTSWEDLLDPKYEGQVIMAHPATSGTAYTVLATLIQLKGEDAAFEYMQELSKNITQFTKSGSAAPNGVALGEAAIAITFSHDGLQPTAEGYPIELSFPSDGTGYEVGAAAVVKGAPEDEQNAAKLFIDFMCSQEGQSLYATNDSFRCPVRTTADVGEGLVTIDSVECIDYDAVWAAENKDTFTAEFEEKVAEAPEDEE